MVLISEANSIEDVERVEDIINEAKGNNVMTTREYNYIINLIEEKKAELNEAL